ncbi:MAG: sensor domain-containing diguanylate cyclase [Pseudomonadota bacterium]
MQRKRLAFILALTGMLTLGFVTTSLVSYFLVKDSVQTRLAEETLPLTSDNILSEIERDLLRSILISSLMAHDTFVRDWTREGEKTPERIIRYLGEIQRKYDTTTAFFAADDSKRYYHPDGILKTISRANAADAWYFRARQMNEPFEINIDHDTADPSRLTIFVNYRVVDAQGDFLGVTGIGLAVETVAELIESYQQRYGRDIYFIDHEGQVTLHGSEHRGPDSIQEQPGLSRHSIRVLTSPSTAFSYETESGEEVYVNTRLIPELDWYLVVEQGESGADPRLLGTLIVNVMLALGVAILVIVIAWAVLRQYERRLENLATTDPLTGTANRSALEMQFDQAGKVEQRSGQPFSLLALDIDHFKTINDRHGHEAGDVVLRSVADLIGREIREVDTLCRWGGDEFLILLQQAGGADALRTAERIREAIGSTPIRLPNGRRVEVSVTLGVATHRVDEPLKLLMRRADQALYRAKEAGRDRVETDDDGDARP